MKTDPFRSPLPSARTSGVALVLVLGFLVLISALIVAFFSSVSTDLSAANSYAAGVTTKQLADTATNLVIGEITDATQGYTNPTDQTSGLLAWASQPGMIRTYDQNGIPYRYYKLYSAANMVMTSPPTPAKTPAPNGSDPMSLEFANDVPVNWANEIGLYTDLNAPVLVPDTNGTITSANGFKYRADYPIVDPSAMGPIPASWPPTSPGMVEGFQIDSKRLGAGDPTNPASTPASNPAPMPCRWLYVLKDGTVLPPSSATNGKVTFETAPVKPSSSNPIVGRVAFWTDDETCKVNLNTAGEGTFWDQPRGTQAGYEANLGSNIPGQNEFQRFAGHPAMTCLSTVFENLHTYWQNPTIYPMTGGGLTSLQNYLSFAPRLVFGGSQGGTTIPTTTVISADHDRLFASTDEMAFDTHYSGSGTPTRALDTNLTRSDLEKLKFFVTVGSRAPEVNLFNKPRICLWPIQAGSGFRNPKDQLLAFCTSTGTGGTYFPYYFQRQSIYYPGSGPGAGYDGITGFNPKVPSSQSTWEDFALNDSNATAGPSTSRNALLYAYLRSLTSQNIPGFGGNFQTKYDSPNMTAGGYSDRDQILTEMFDMIRSGVNSYNTAVNPKYDYAPTRNGAPAPGETQIVPAVIGPAGTGYPNSKLVTTDTSNPSYNPGITKGFGRFNTIHEVAIVFFSNGLVDPTKPFSATNPTIVQAAIILDPFNPSPGLASWSPHVRCAITGLGGFSINDKNFGNNQSLYFPDATAANNNRMPFNYTTARVGYVDGNHNMSIMGLLTQFHYFQSSPDPAKVVGNDGTQRTYPFVSQAPGGSKYPGALVSTPNFEFNGGMIKIQVFAGYEPVTNGNPTQLVQTLMVNFPWIRATNNTPYPSATLPVPIVTADNFNTRIANNTLIEPSAGTSNDTDLAASGDVVRSMKVTSDSPTGAGANSRNPSMGDLRILAALDVVPPQMFSPHASYFVSTRRAAHSLRNGGPNYLPGAQLVQIPPTLVTGQKWTPDPAVPAGQISARAAYGGVGDFDNNMGGNEDGPYVNKPDEGNTATGTGTYFGRGGFAVENGASYSPNRQVSSAVMFGSLPSGVKATEYALVHNALGDPSGGKPWQTLLFCPNPAGGTLHPGFGTSAAGSGQHFPPYVKNPPDHLFLDLFTMPIVEPYAISEPFSTAGKINLNYRIAPFTHITRSTGIRAVMKSTKVLAIKTNDLNKSQAGRYNIEMEPTHNGTLVGFENVFNRGDIFRSASQICDIFLVPQGTTAQYNSMDSWWGAYLHTGDNGREYPYGHIYPRVTTKSNTFTVHMRVQTLQKANSRVANANTSSDTATFWDETKDHVVGEYRGSNTIERYIDLPYSGSPATDLPDFAAQNTKAILDPYYKFRTISSKRFAP